MKTIKNNALKVLPLALLLTAGCSKSSKSRHGETPPSPTPTAAAAIPEPQAAAPVATPAPTPLTQYNLGLPSFCAGTRQGVQECIVCKPAEFANRRCFDVADTFDAAKDCRYDLATPPTVLVCRSKTGEEISMDLVKSRFEKLLDAMPIFSLGAKTFVNERLKDNEKLRTAAGSIIDLVSGFSKDVSLGKRHDEAADNLISIISRYKPDITAEQKTKVRDGATAAFRTLSTQVAQGLNPGLMDLLTMMRNVVGLIPGQESGTLTSMLDTASILTAVQNMTGGQDSLKQLLSIFGVNSFEDLLKS